MTTAIRYRDVPVEVMHEDAYVAAWEAEQDRQRGRPLFEATEEDLQIAFYREHQAQMKKVSGID